MGLLTVVGSIGGATGAFNLLTQSSALAASTLPASTPLAFEAADGNMACDGTGGGAGCSGTTPNYLDWASPYVTSSPAFLNEPDSDPGCTSQDLIFTQGSKEDDTAPTVTCAPSTPKVALSQAYAWNQTIGSDHYLYLAWEAPNQTGSNNNHIDFELNQQPQNYPYSSTNLIPNGGATWTLNRTNGDLLFDFDITPTTPEICYSVWDSTLNSGAGGWGVPPASQNPTYDANCTAANGEAVLSGALAAVGGSFTDPINHAVLPSGAFGEMGIDMNAAGLFTPGACTNFTNVWVKGRSSGSGGTSELKSFIAPQGVTVENCAPPGFTTQVSPTTSAALGSGASWTDSATLTGTSAGGAPGGSVDFHVCTEATAGTPCSSGGTDLGSVTITSAMQNSSTDVTTVPLPTANAQSPHAAGTYCFWAAYTAPTSNTKYLSVSPESNPQDECFTVNPASTTVTTAAGSGIVVGSGGTVTDTANIFSSGGVALAAGDTVQFYMCKISSSTGQSGSCAATAANADGSPVSVSGTPSSSGTTSAVHATSPAVSPTTAGSYCFSAVFSAPSDPNYTGSSENTTGSGVAAECFNVSPASTTTVTQTSGNVTLSPTGSAFDTANIFSSGGQPLAAGDTVQFYLCKVSSSTGQAGSCAATAANADGSPVSVSGTPSSSGTTSAVQAVSPSVTPTSVGSYCFSAVFSAPSDPNYTGSSENTTGSGVAAECFSVAPTSTTTTTTASGDVTLSPTGSAHDTANIFSTGGVPLASGDTVQFYVCKVSSSTGQVGSCAATAANADGSPVAVSGTPSSSGTTSAVQATSPTVTPTSAGSYCFSAVFNASGDPNYTGSSENTSGSGVAAECFSVNPASTTTTTQTSGTVTLSPTGSAFDTATISSDGGVALASGDTVQFYVCHVSSSTGVVGSCAATAANADGSPVAASGTPQPAGSGSPLTVQSPTVTLSSPGSYCFSAVFNASGDPNYTGSSENTSGDGVAAECFNVLHPDFTVQKTDTPGDGNPVDPGSTIPYTVTITNTGDGTGSATVTDNAPSNETVSGTPVCGTLTGSDTCQVSGSGNDWTIDVTLAAGDSVSVTFSAVVSATDTTDVVNTASITSGACTADCSSTVTNPVPNISVAKSVDPASGTAVFPGDTLTYTLTVTNNGSGTGTETVNDAAPTNTTLVAGSAACGTAPSGGSCSVTSSTGTLGWSVTLPGDSSMDVTFQVKVNADDTATITNFGTFSGPGCASDSCSTNTVNNPVIVLSAVKDSTPAPGSTVNLTQTVTYSITLSNAGTGTATGVTLTDAIPTGTSYVADSASCGGAPGCSVSESGGTVTWTGLNVAPGAASAITVTFQVTVNSTDTNGQVISNFGVFTNEGTPGCTGSTCHTNTVTLTVVVPITTPSSTTTSTIPQATTVHTGEPWAGSRPLEILAFALGLALIAIGELERRRARRLFARRQVD